MTSTPASSLPPLNAALLPPDVRHADAKDKRAYESARGFERMLLGQLTKSMVVTAKPTDDGSDSSAVGQGGVGAPYSQMLPDQLADAISSAGGIGLADNLYKSLKAARR
ncbi:MAG: hypothetical protein NVSMB25_16800 [Thermoleophilaceae bacterium]